MGSAFEEIRDAVKAVWLAVLLAVAAAAVMAAAAVVIVGLFGGLNTSGEHLDWAVVSALASVVGTVTTVALAAGLVITVKQFEAEQARGLAEAQSALAEQRSSRFPLIRVDVGFANHSGQRTFRPPSSGTYSLTDLYREGYDAALLARVASERGNAVTLWLTNIQTQALGLAVDIEVELLVEWMLGGQAGMVGPLENCSLSVGLAYLRPLQTTAVELFRSRFNATELRVSTISVTYKDFTRDFQSGEVFGALNFRFDGESVWNPRGVMVHTGREVTTDGTQA